MNPRHRLEPGRLPQRRWLPRVLWTLYFVVLTLAIAAFVIFTVLYYRDYHPDPTEPPLQVTVGPGAPNTTPATAVNP
jgi:hypothetical protein